MQEGSADRILRDCHWHLPTYDGAAEYFVDLDTFSAALGTPEGQQAMQLLIDDKRNFVDFTKSALWYAEEHIVIPTE